MTWTPNEMRGGVYYQKNGVKTYAFNSSEIPLLDLYQRSAGVTPGFNKLRRSGKLIPPTSLSVNRVEAEVEECSYSYQKGTTTYDYTAEAGYIPREYTTDWLSIWEAPLAIALTVPLPSSSVMVQNAAKKIMGNSFDALTFLAEAASTARMLRNAASTVHSLATRPSLKRYFNAWLEGRYGWRPLISDCQSLYEAYTTLENRTRFSEKSYANREYVEVDDDPWSYHADGLPIRPIGEMRTEWKVSHVGAVVADIELPKYSFNPIRTAWELIPLSFVVDWFVGIGTSLEVEFLRNQASTYYAHYGWKYELTRKCDFTWASYDPSYTNVTGNFKSTSNVVRVGRRPTSLPFLPPLRVNLDLAKSMDLLALTAQRIPKGRIKRWLHKPLR